MPTQYSGGFCNVEPYHSDTRLQLLILFFCHCCWSWMAHEALYLPTLAAIKLLHAEHKKYNNGHEQSLITVQKVLNHIHVPGTQAISAVKPPRFMPRPDHGNLKRIWWTSLASPPYALLIQYTTCNDGTAIMWHLHLPSTLFYLTCVSHLCCECLQLHANMHNTLTLVYKRLRVFTYPAWLVWS